MYRPRPRDGAIGFLLELALWASLCGFFLFVYVGRYAAQGASIVPHVALVGTCLFGLWCVRLLVWRLFGATGRWINVLVCAAFFGVLVVYYALVVIGLQSWGRVISWRLIATYSTQAGELVGSLGMSPWTVSGIGALALAGLVACVALVPPRLHWTRALAQRLSVFAAVAVSLAGLAIVAVRLYQFVAVTPGAVGEPVSLTLFPEEAARKLQSHSTDGARALDIAEAAARSAYVPDANAARRNVIVIVGDALRADHLGVYGYARETTPYLDALQRDGRLVRQAQMIGACAESSCGLLAMARSKYVHQLSRHSFTLQDVLRRYGYRIHMILGGDHTNFYGLREAYGEVDSYFDGGAATSFYMNDDDLVVDHLERFPDWNAEPTLLQFHLMSSHALGKRHEASMRYAPSKNYSVFVRREGAVQVDRDEIDQAVNYYDNGVLQFDLMVKKILDILERKKYLQDALVVVTADHGESLGEHDEFGHAKSIYQTAVRLPFLLLRYGYDADAPIDTARVASQVDIAPTILAELRMHAPTTWAGFALQAPFRRDWLFVQQGANVGLVDVRDPARTLKYWKNLRRGAEYVFDIVADPAERDNLLSTLPEALLAEWRMAVLPAAAGATQQQ